MYRGLLCFNCNTGLGQFGDSEQLVESALKYLTSTKPRELLLEHQEKENP